MPTNLHLQSERWFAWAPVIAHTRDGWRLAWLETITRERYVTAAGAGAWRYLA